MALTRNREVDHYIDQELRSFQVAKGAHVFRGAFVGLNDEGLARGLVAGDLFAGVAYEEIDNESGHDGDLSVRVYTLGDFGHNLPDAAVSEIGKPVFAMADDKLTFAPQDHTYVGWVQDRIARDEVILRLDTMKRNPHPRR